MLRVATHNGTFHADDVFAFAILTAATAGDLELLRSRDPQTWESADVVFDVGGVFDRARQRYDHHMRDLPMRDDGAPYSSAGLIWRDWGRRALQALLPAGEPAAVEAVWLALDSGLIKDVDLMDNGAMPPVPGHLSLLLEEWNPTFVEAGRDEDSAFLEAAAVAGAVLARAAAHAFAAAEAQGQVAAAAAVADDPRIIVLDRRVPWEEAVFALDLAQALYVVRPAGNGWTVSAVPPQRGSFAQRRPLPERWAGLRDAELVAQSGVADATFCHPARFVCGAGSRDGAVALARLAVDVM